MSRNTKSRWWCTPWTLVTTCFWKDSQNLESPLNCLVTKLKSDPLSRHRTGLHRDCPGLAGYGPIWSQFPIGHLKLCGFSIEETGANLDLWGANGRTPLYCTVDPRAKDNKAKLFYSMLRKQTAGRESCFFLKFPHGFDVNGRSTRRYENCPLLAVGTEWTHCHGQDPDRTVTSGLQSYRGQKWITCSTLHDDMLSAVPIQLQSKPYSTMALTPSWMLWGLNSFVKLQSHNTPQIRVSLRSIEMKKRKSNVVSQYYLKSGTCQSSQRINV